jgi:hypothetical protein
MGAGASMPRAVRIFGREVGIAQLYKNWRLGLARKLCLQVHGAHDRLQTSRVVLEAHPAQFEHQVAPLRQILRSGAAHCLIVPFVHLFSVPVCAVADAYRTVGMSLVEKLTALPTFVTTVVSTLIPTVRALNPITTTTTAVTNETTTILM